MKLTVGIIGGGPWGFALAHAAVRAGSEVVLHTRRPHPGAPGMRVTTDWADITRSHLLVIAVPTGAVRDVARSLGDHLDGSHFVLHGIRGLGFDGLETVSEVIREESSVRRIGALGGPVQAVELAEGKPSAIVCGSAYSEVSEAFSRGFQSASLRVYRSSDIRGLEWSSALVGCLAVGVGFAQERGVGPGLLAALISRAVDDAAKLITAAGADPKTMFGLGGYGDLLASLALTDRPEVVLGRSLARGAKLDAAMDAARLRVEAVELIPRLAQFASERKVAAPTFAALGEVLAGGSAPSILEKFLKQ